MEPKFQTSFIPKKPINSSQNSGIDVMHDTNIFSVIAAVVFIVSILVSGGLFFYKKSLISQIAKADSDILATKAAFEPEKIKELMDINNRLLSTKNLLENHIVVSQILVLMEDLVLKKMRFVDFKYANHNTEPTITVSGEIQTYNALAEQQSVFSQNEYLKETTFTNFNLAENGYIQVNFTAKIVPALLSYKRSIESPSN